MGDAAQEQLVERSRRGDAAAFASLIATYERIALSIAYGVTGDAAAASDVVQDGFFRAWQRLADLKEPGRFGAWLCGIVRNLSIDVARSQAVRAAYSTDHGPASASAASPDGNPLDELGRQEDRRRVAEAIKRLDDLSRSAVVLRYYENLSSKQIGELLGLAPTAVDMRLMRARRQLRQFLEEADEDDGSGARATASPLEVTVSISPDEPLLAGAAARRGRGGGRAAGRRRAEGAL